MLSFIFCNITDLVFLELNRFQLKKKIILFFISIHYPTHKIKLRLKKKIYSVTRNQHRKLQCVCIRSRNKTYV